MSWPSSSRSESADAGEGTEMGVQTRDAREGDRGGRGRRWRAGAGRSGRRRGSRRLDLAKFAGMARGAPSNSLMMPDRARRRAPERARAVLRPSRWSRGRCHDAASAGRARRSDVWRARVAPGRVDARTGSRLVNSSTRFGTRVAFPRRHSSASAPSHREALGLSERCASTMGEVAITLDAFDEEFEKALYPLSASDAVRPVAPSASSPPRRC